MTTDAGPNAADLIDCGVVDYGDHQRPTRCAVPIKGIAVPLRVVAIMAVGRMQADVKPFADGVGLAALFFRKHVTA